MWSPGPPLHWGEGRGVGVDAGAGVEALAGGGVGEGVRDAAGPGSGAADDAAAPMTAEGEGYTACTDRGAGGAGRVSPMTKYTVSMTAVTLAAVHDSHMRR
ncbi:hypothetical protein ACIPUC_01665 [Streptomyces sp. LARHCF249]